LRNVSPLKIGRVLHDTKHNSCHCNANRLKSRLCFSSYFHVAMAIIGTQLLRDENGLSHAVFMINIYHDKYARVEQKLAKNGYVLNFKILFLVWSQVVKISLRLKVR